MGFPDLALVPAEQDVVRAAADIVAAFASTDTNRYFSCFSEDATFVFHSEPSKLSSRRKYEELWEGWLGEGWKVIACESSKPLVTTFPGGAVFIHEVATTVETPDSRESYRERESIIFRLTEDGSLTAIHEHLSPAPALAQ